MLGKALPYRGTTYISRATLAEAAAYSVKQCFLISSGEIEDASNRVWGRVWAFAGTAVLGTDCIRTQRRWPDGPSMPWEGGGTVAKTKVV